MLPKNSKVQKLHPYNRKCFINYSLGRIGLGVVDVVLVVDVVRCDVDVVIIIRFVVSMPIFASRLARFFEISSSILDSDTENERLVDCSIDCENDENLLEGWKVSLKFNGNAVRSHASRWLENSLVLSN